MATAKFVIGAGLALLLTASPGCDDGGAVTDAPSAGDDGGDGKADALSDFPCGDGSAPLCRVRPPDCPGGQTPFIEDECFGECVDAETCEPPEAYPCGDGSMPRCRVREPACPDGQTPFIEDECFGECVDDETCEPPEAYPCGDGSAAVCEILPPECPDGETPFIEDGCFGDCVDAQTCE